MARLVRGRVPVRAPQRRLTTWGGVQSNSYANVPAASKLFFASFSAAGLANIQRSTLIRVRGIISVKSDQSGGIEDAMGAFGIAVVTDTARAVGVTALPAPSDDAAGDYWQTWQALFSPPIDATIDNELFMIDSKGQRKLSDLDAIVLMFENTHATHGMDVAVQLRFLFLLS